jgi:hypothetical protein
VEEKVSRKGNEMLVVTFQSCKDAAEIKYYIVDGEFAPCKLKALEKAFEIPFGSGAERFLGKKGVARTVEDVFNGVKTPKVEGFAPFDPKVTYESRPIERGEDKPRPMETRSELPEDVPF